MNEGMWYLIGLNNNTIQSPQKNIAILFMGMILTLYFAYYIIKKMKK